MNEIESRNDGRIVLFRDIYKMEATYSHLKRGGRVQNSMKVILYTQEDDLQLESVLPSDQIEQWAMVVRECIMFCIIPVPEAHPDATLRAMPPGRDGFRSTSGVVFGANVDVTFLINSVLEDPAVRNEIFPAIAKLCQYVGDIFALVRDVKCNRDAFGQLSSRVADMMRLMLDSQSHGLLLSVSESDTGLVTFQLNGMCSKGLADALDFVQAMCSPNWLQETMKFGKSGFRAKFERLEQEILIKCANRIISGLSGNKSLLFKKHNYDMVVEVSEALDAIGTVDQIYSNPAKIQAFSRVVQGDPSDIFNELELLLEKDNKLALDDSDFSTLGTLTATSEKEQSANSTRGTDKTQPIRRPGIFASLCCCWCGRAQNKKPTLRRKSYKFSNNSGLDQKLLNGRGSRDGDL